MGAEKTIVLYDGQAKPRLVPSTRFTLALMVFYAFIVQYSQRVNLPIAIVCMVDRTKTVDPRSFNLTTSTTRMAFNNDRPLNGINNDMNPTSTAKDAGSIRKKGGPLQERQFRWIELHQQVLLGSYWAGYIFTQVPGGWLATNLGAKWVYASSLFISSIATLALTIMYMMATTHVLLILILRFIIGLAHGVLFPATIALWSLWAVPDERSTLASIGFCGTHLGTSLTMLIGGILCRYFNSGWMYLFFLTSILGFVWLALWMWLTADSPMDHPRISPHERDYICRITGSTGKRPPMSLATIPWKHMVTSKPLVALFITHIANLFGLFFFLTNLGKILTEIHHVPTQYTGYILSGGFFLTLTSSLSSGIVADRLVRAEVMTLTNVRKMFNSLTSFVPVVCMASLCFCDQSRQLQGVITVLIFLAISGLGYGSAYVVNFADIVPAYSGLIFGIANTFASLAGLIGNIVAGIVVTEPVLEQWRKLYIMFGIVYLIGGLVYVPFGSAVPRKWAKFQTASSAQQETHVDEETVPMNETGIKNLSPVDT